MHRIAVFASGSGSNARKIMEHLKSNPLFRVGLVLTNRSKAGVLKHAEEMDVPSLCIPSSMFRDSPDYVLLQLKKADIEFIVLAGFLIKVPDLIVNAFTDRMINIHPALLPAYGGEGMYGDHVHEAVIRNRESKSGITIHWVNKEYDKGEIIFQASVEVDSEDTVDSLRSKVQSLEHQWFPLVLEQVLNRTFRGS